MNRLGIKFTITMLLAVILALLLLDRATRGGQRLLNDEASDATLPLIDDLRSEIQRSLSDGASRSLLETGTVPHVQLPLLRDPFAFRLPYEPQHSPYQTEHMPPLEELSAPPVEEMLQLKATVIDRYGALAFINDEVVTEGQSILGHTVVRIAAGHVELARNGTKVYLRLEDGGEP